MSDEHVTLSIGGKPPGVSDGEYRDAEYISRSLAVMLQPMAVVYDSRAVVNGVANALGNIMFQTIKNEHIPSVADAIASLIKEVAVLRQRERDERDSLAAAEAKGTA